jgi:hypothetical protein
MVNASDGRDSNGRFAPGWKGGPGNPHAKKTARLREALLSAVTEADLKKAAAALLAKATKGDIAAFKELCDRILGRPSSSDLHERVERLEELIEATNNG